MSRVTAEVYNVEFDHFVTVFRFIYATVLPWWARDLEVCCPRCGRMYSCRVGWVSALCTCVREEAPRYASMEPEMYALVAIIVFETGACL